MIDLLQAVEEPMQNVDAQSNWTSDRRNANSTDIHGGVTNEHAAAMEVLIVHEDLRTGLRAKEVMDLLAENLGLKLHFVMRFWTFEMLGDPELQELAVSEATTAHILFISLRGANELPQAVCTLVDCWLADREEQYSALVVSLDKSLRESSTAHAVLDHLCTKTRAGSVDLFPHFAAAPPAGRDWDSLGVQVQDDMRQMSAVAPHLHEPLRRWGLNE